MKLETSIKPRADGSVVSRVGETTYVFKPDATGALTADVADEHADMLMNTGNFYPADADDFEVAAVRLNQPVVDGMARDLIPADDFDDEADDIPVDTALPIEENTPPKATVRKVKKEA